MTCRKSRTKVPFFEHKSPQNIDGSRSKTLSKSKNGCLQECYHTYEMRLRLGSAYIAHLQIRKLFQRRTQIFLFGFLIVALRFPGIKVEPKSNKKEEGERRKRNGKSVVTVQQAAIAKF